MEATPSQGTSEREIQLDAMGQDKRRRVVGQGYGPSKFKQLLYYGLAVAFVIALFIGGRIAVDEFDKAPENQKDQAPWSKSDAPQIPAQHFQ